MTDVLLTESAETPWVPFAHLDPRERMRLCRKWMDWSHATLAEMVGVSRASVCAWEAGEWRPRPQFIYQMAELFDVPVWWLRGFNDEASAARFDARDRGADQAFQWSTCFATLAGHSLTGCG